MSDKPFSQPALSIRALNKEFIVDGKRIPVLRDINLSIQRGEFVAIVGGSGSGKSTLLRIIAGLETSFSGTVELDGKPIEGPDTDRGFVFQEHRLLPWLTVAKNIAFGWRGRKEKQKELVEAHLNLVGLKGFGAAYPHQLSGGMSQRAAIARSLINRPKVLLMDEPFGALDAFTKIQMQEEVMKIWRAEGTTVILVTHDIEEAVYLADRVLVISNRPGTIRAAHEIQLSRPRDRNNADFVEYRRRIFREFFGEKEEPFAYAI
ncbi:MAG: ABC transporter ATP-binding protein [Chthoniobacteraceae bacterium]